MMTQIARCTNPNPNPRRRTSVPLPVNARIVATERGGGWRFQPSPQPSANGRARAALSQVGLIDFQWTGFGLGATDVAYLIASSAEAGLLTADGAGEAALLDAYHADLTAALVEFGAAPDAAAAQALYPRGALQEQYETALLDVFRLAVAYQWVRIEVCAQARGGGGGGGVLLGRGGCSAQTAVGQSPTVGQPPSVRSNRWTTAIGPPKPPSVRSNRWTTAVGPFQPLDNCHRSAQTAVGPSQPPDNRHRSVPTARQLPSVRPNRRRSVPTVGQPPSVRSNRWTIAIGPFQPLDNCHRSAPTAEKPPSVHRNHRTTAIGRSQPPDNRHRSVSTTGQPPLASLQTASCLCVCGSALPWPPRPLPISLQWGGFACGTPLDLRPLCRHCLPLPPPCPAHRPPNPPSRPARGC